MPNASPASETNLNFNKSYAKRKPPEAKPSETNPETNLNFNKSYAKRTPVQSTAKPNQAKPTAKPI
jgi:hypothetical protein